MIYHLEPQVLNQQKYGNPATKAKAIASGTKAKATVKPDKTSILNKEKDTPSFGI